MQYTITVLGEGGQPLPGAKVIFGARDGYGTLNLTADKNGVASFDDSQTGDLSNVAVYWTASSPGYQTYTWYNDEGLSGNKTVTLAKSVGTQTALLVGAGLGVLLLYSSAQKNNKKVSGIDFKKDVVPYVVPGLLLVGGYIVVHKVLSVAGFVPTAEDNARDNTLDNALNNAGPTSLSAIEISATADSIAEDLGYSWISNNTTDAVNQLYKMQNTADALTLLKAYGRRVIHTFGIPRGEFTLEQTVTSQMGTDEIKYVNEDWAGKGINFKF